MQTHSNQNPNLAGSVKHLFGFRRAAPSWRETAKLSGSGASNRLTFGSFLHFLLGVCLFAPGFSVFTVGKHTGVQSALVLCGVCGILRVYRGGWQKDPLLTNLLVVWALFGMLTVSLGGFKAIDIHSMVGFDACLIILAIFGLKWKIPESYNLNLQRGLIVGAVISAVYAIYQQAAIQFGLPYGVPPLNNPTFALITDAEDPGPRSFAFCSEPSILAAYIMPITIATLFLAINQRGAKALRLGLIPFFLFVGIMASGSFSVFTSLPIIIFLGLLAQRQGMFGLVKASVGLLGVGLLVLFLIGTSDWAANLSDGLAKRISYAMDDQSLITRYGMKVASFKIFLDHPFFGSGVLPDPEYFYASMPADSVIYQSAETLAGGDSLPLVMLSGQGICGFVCFALLIYVAVKRSFRNLFLRFTLIGCVVTMSLQCGNYDLYLIWVVLGLCLSQPAKLPVTSGLTPVRATVRESMKAKLNGIVRRARHI